MSKFDDNQECVNMLYNIQGSLANRFREAYNKGYKQGLKDGANQVKSDIITKILAIAGEGADDE